MDQALLLRCGNSQILPQPSFITRSKIISARKLTNSRDLIFFSSKNTTTTTPLISSLSKCFSTTLTVGHPQRINARRLISIATLVRAGNSYSDDNEGTFPMSALELLKGFLHGILYLTSSTDEPKSELHKMRYNEDVLKLKKEVFDELKKNKSTDAVKNAFDKLEEKKQDELEKNKTGADKPHYTLISDDIDLVSVEILIYKGSYDKAWNILVDLMKHHQEQDIRPLLFKAIIHTMMKDKRETAKNPWDELIKKGFEQNLPFAE